MRRFSFVMMVTMAGLLGIAGSASADGSVDLIWTSSSNTAVSGVGTSAISASSGDALTLGVFLTAGTEGISSYGISVSFDGPGFNELDLNPIGSTTAATEFGLKPTVTCTPFPSCFFESPTMSNFTPGVSSVIESDGSNTGFVYTFEAGTLGSGVLNTFGAFMIGEINFTVNTPVNGGPTLNPGFFRSGVDAAYSNAGTPVTMSFNGAAVDTFGPEPGTTVLLGLGLVSLAMAGRRKRS
jgi:hypothetical protein